MSEARERLYLLCCEYALDLLEGEERQELEEKLRTGDAEAVAAWAEAQRTVVSLAAATPPAEPPAGMAEKLRTAAAADAGSALPAPPRQRRAAAPVWLPWAAAAAIALVAGWSLWQRADLSQRIAGLEEQRDELAAELEQAGVERQRYERALEILSAPETRLIGLDAPQNQRLQAYWSERLGLLLAGSGLPETPAGRALQLWAIPRQGAPVSVEVFRPTDGEAFVIAQPALPPNQTSALAVTEEPAGGSPQPTMQPIWVGPLG